MTSSKLGRITRFAWQNYNSYDLSSLAPLAREICFRWRNYGLEEFDRLALVLGQVVPGGLSR